MSGQETPRVTSGWRRDAWVNGTDREEEARVNQHLVMVMQLMANQYKNMMQRPAFLPSLCLSFSCLPHRPLR